MRLRWLHLRFRPDSLDRRWAGAATISSWRLPEHPLLGEALARLGSTRSSSDLDDPRIMQLCGALAQAIGEAMRDLPRAPVLPTALRAALDCIERTATARPDLALLATTAGVSVAHLHRLFRDHLGTTPARCLEDRRLDTAQAMLASGDQPVAEVAAACGYSDPFHFSRIIRRRLGISPSGLRLRGLPSS